MTKIDSRKIKDAYLAAGGTEDSWRSNKDQMIEAARQQAAVGAAIADANRQPTLNELMRDAFQGNDNGFVRFAGGNLEGDAA